MWWGLLAVLLEWLIKWLTNVQGLNAEDVSVAEAVRQVKSKKFKAWARQQRVILPN